MNRAFKGGISSKGLAAAALSAAALAACGGGSDEEAVSVDPTVLCNSAGAQPKVVNGASCVSFKSTPVVLLRITLGDGSLGVCSGTRISATHVLTAAHCLDDNPKRVDVAAFSSDTSGKFLKAKSWVSHPGYDGSVAVNDTVNDAAVITFPAGLANPTMPILASQPSEGGQAVYFAGWGLPAIAELAVGGGNLSSTDEVRLSIKGGDKESAVCQGDSGGPLYRSLAGGPAMVGISFAVSAIDCTGKETAFFTNIQTPVVLDFIRASAPGAVIL